MIIGKQDESIFSLKIVRLIPANPQMSGECKSNTRVQVLLYSLYFGAGERTRKLGSTVGKDNKKCFILWTAKQPRLKEDRYKRTAIEQYILSPGVSGTECVFLRNEGRGKKVLRCFEYYIPQGPFLLSLSSIYTCVCLRHMCTFFALLSGPQDSTGCKCAAGPGCGPDMQKKITRSFAALTATFSSLNTLIVADRQR